MAYWLGTLSPADQGHLEEAYFSDNDLYGELLDAKDSLIRGYLDRTLTDAERRRFEQFFLTQPGRRAEVAMMQCVLRQPPQPAVTENRSFLDWLRQSLGGQPDWGFAPALTVGAVLLLCVSGLLWYRWISDAGATLSAQNAGHSTPLASSVVTLRLGSQLREASAPAHNSLQKYVGLQTLNLQIEVEQTAFSSYCVTLAASGQPEVVVTRLCGLSLQTLGGRDLVSAPIAVERLAAADYEVALYGVKADQTQVALRRHPFTVR
jgi:hypothetical protein